MPEFSMTKKELTARIVELENIRRPFMDEWQEITTFIQPRKGRYISSDNTRLESTKAIVNSTSTSASDILAAGLMSGLTSPARPWFELGTPDPDLMRSRMSHCGLRS